jgi:hypothetical protein
MCAPRGRRPRLRENPFWVPITTNAPCPRGNRYLRISGAHTKTPGIRFWRTRMPSFVAFVFSNPSLFRAVSSLRWVSRAAEYPLHLRTGPWRNLARNPKWAEYKPITDDAFLERQPVRRLGFRAIAADAQVGDNSLRPAIPFEWRPSVRPVTGPGPAPAIGGVE